MRKRRFADPLAAGALVIAMCAPAPVGALTLPGVDAGRPGAAAQSPLHQAYWAWGPYGRYWVPDRPPPPAYYGPAPPPYYVPPTRPRVWVERHWDGYRWIPGHW